MKVLFDTNVAIAALVEVHPNHIKAFNWLKKAKEKEITGIISAHSIAEIYAVITTLPIFPKIPPLLAEKLIQQNIFSNFEIIELTKQDYQEVLHILAENSTIGGSTYDALIAHAAIKGKVDKLLSFNEKHLKRVYPAIAYLVQTPA